jgi:hypothetical protein
MCITAPPPSPHFKQFLRNFSIKIFVLFCFCSIVRLKIQVTVMAWFRGRFLRRNAKNFARNDLGAVSRSQFPLTAKAEKVRKFNTVAHVQPSVFRRQNFSGRISLSWHQALKVCARCQWVLVRRISKLIYWVYRSGIDWCYIWINEKNWENTQEACKKLGNASF